MEKLSTKATYLSLKDYQKIAIKLISKGAHHFVKSEDAISKVMHALMLADKRWNGKGDQRAYRIWCGKKGVLDLFKQFKRTSKKYQPMISLNETLTSKTGDYQRGDNIKSKLQSPAQIAEFNDLKTYIQSAKLLTEFEKIVLVKYFFENETEPDIAEQLSLTQQRINAIKNSGIAKLRSKFNVSK